MKLILLLLFLSSCSMTAYVGMPQSDFVNKNKGMGVSLVESSAQRDVYRWCNSYTCYFYYFHNGTMYSFDEGETEPDYLIYNR